MASMATLELASVEECWALPVSKQHGSGSAHRPHSAVRNAAYGASRPPGMLPFVSVWDF